MTAMDQRAPAIGIQGAAGGAHRPAMRHFHGVWMARSAPLAFRVLPKCGCSSVGQVIHQLDHGRFHPGSVHDADAPILKWSDRPNNMEIRRRFREQRIVSFTMVRNPYRRLISAFADKIFGYQSDGRRYRNGEIHGALHRYGVRWDARSDLIDNFHGFIRFVADTVERGTPMAPDLHWNPCTVQLGKTAAAAPGWRLDAVGRLETFAADMDAVLTLAGVPADRRPPRAPSENATSLPPIPLDTLFGAAERAIVRRIYAADFAAFGYGPEPGDPPPATAPDLDRVNAAIRC
jgi:hypothetical protein